MIPFADTINAACVDPKRLLLVPSPNYDERGLRALAVQVRAMLRSSRRFYIDEEVVRAASRLGVQHPKVLYEMLNRARTPFEKIWLEWPLDAQLEEAGQKSATDAPLRAGAFIERLDEAEPIYRMMQVGGPPRNIDRQYIALPALSVIYNLHTPFLTSSAESEQIQQISQMPKDFINMTLLGKAYSGTDPSDADEEEMEERQRYCDALSMHAKYIFNPLTRSYVVPALAGNADRVLPTAAQDARTHIRITIRETSGQWRLIIALLALINAQDFVERSSYRYGRNHIVRATVVPYLEHITVKLKLPRHIVQDRLVRQYVEYIPRRRHEVMGHWKQSRKRGDPNCDHAYIDVTPSRQRCALCAHSRWWVNEHERGDASIGYVTKDRLVTRS